MYFLYLDFNEKLTTRRFDLNEISQEVGLYGERVQIFPHSKVGTENLYPIFLSNVHNMTTECKVFVHYIHLK